MLHPRGAHSNLTTLSMTVFMHNFQVILIRSLHFWSMQIHIKFFSQSSQHRQAITWLFPTLRNKKQGFIFRVSGI